MRRFIATFVVFASIGAEAKLVTPRRARAEKNFEAGLLRRCEDGHGQSCFDYGYILKRRKAKKDQDRGRTFIRKACRLAYAPACGKDKNSAVRAALAKGRTPDSDRTRGCFSEKLMDAAAWHRSGSGQLVTKVAAGSVWQKGGLKPGDLILTVNDEPLNSASQIANGFVGGGFSATVERGGKIVALSFSCK